jgi:hypothetical protein
VNKIDKTVGIVVVSLLGCVLVKAALEAAVTLVIPVIVAAVVYAVFRAWQKGWLAKLIPEKEKKEAA